MGYAARVNPCAFEGKPSGRLVLHARIRRTLAHIPTREAFEAIAAGLSDAERIELERLLPAHLQPKGTV